MTETCMLCARPIPLLPCDMPSTQHCTCTKAMLNDEVRRLDRIMKTREMSAISPRWRKVLNAFAKHDSFDTAAASSLLRITHASAGQMLSRMRNAGFLFRLRQGVYRVRDQVKTTN